MKKNRKVGTSVDSKSLQNKKVHNGNFKAILSDLINTKSILSKMVLVFLLLIIIPVSTIGFIAANTASKNLLKSTEDSVAAATKQATVYFDVFLGRAQDLSLQVISDSFIQDFSLKTRSDVDEFERFTAQQKASDVVRAINTCYDDFSIKIVFTEGYGIGDITPPQDMGEIMAAGWYKKLAEADGKMVWLDCNEAMEATKNQNYALTLGRVYKDIQTNKGIGFVLVDVLYKPVNDNLSGIDLGKSDTTFLITPEGKVLSAKGEPEEKALAQRQFVKDVFEHLNKENKGLFYTKDTGVNYLVSYNKSEQTGITAVTIVPNSVITEGVTEIIRTTIFAGIIFTILAVTFGFVFSLRMTLSMKAIMGVMLRGENGDLTASLSMKRGDEIGKLVISFNKMMVKIRELITQSKNAASEVASSSEIMAAISADSARASTEVAHAIVEVASGTSNQASEVEISVRNVTQLAEKITFAVEKTKEMKVDSESMKELSISGIITIGNLNSKTEQTNQITSNVVKEISQLNQYVKNINVITQVLRDIADQTNLLALNAAIEAARAGDAGKGFAVVADEIRKLAEQSNTRTREIQKHIENIFKQTQNSTDLVGKAEASIKEQSELVSQTAEVFSRINVTTGSLGENINKVGNMITDMDTYKEMVMSSMENISAVSEQVSASTQEVSASTEEQLASIEQLDHMAKQLNQLADQLIKEMEIFIV